MLTAFNDPGEDGHTEALQLCVVHMYELDAMGVITWLPLTRN